MAKTKNEGPTGPGRGDLSRVVFAWRVVGVVGGCRGVARVLTEGRGLAEELGCRDVVGRLRGYVYGIEKGGLEFL